MNRNHVILKRKEHVQIKAVEVTELGEFAKRRELTVLRKAETRHITVNGVYEEFRNPTAPLPQEFWVWAVAIDDLVERGMLTCEKGIYFITGIGRSYLRKLEGDPNAR